MTLSKNPYKGTRDFFPKEKRVLDYIFSKMKQTAEKFSYEPYDGPVLEEVDLYKAKSGEELINEQIYSFYDRGKRFVAIRPEMTPTLARMIAQIHRNTVKPIRWYSIPNLMRYERPQKGRLREHWQFNCDIFGAPKIMGEIEILQLAIHLMRSFGANEEHFEILVNDRDLVDIVFEKSMGLDKKSATKLYKIIDKLKKVDKKVFKTMIGDLNLTDNASNILEQYLSLQTFDDAIQFLNQNNEAETANEVDTFYQKIKALGIDKYFKFDPSIVRGLDYYTGIVFEIFDKHPNNKRAICGGGAFANLLQIFNEPALTGVGFGLGDVTLTDFLKVHNLLPNLDVPQNDLFITFQDQSCELMALRLASSLREKNIKVGTNLETIKINKAFSLAEKKGAKYIAFLGKNELAKNEIQIKNMINRKQFNISMDNLSELQRIIHNE